MSEEILDEKVTMEEKEIIVLDDIEEEQETRSIREECIELLNLCAADDHFLIALDMDYTLWPIFCYEDTLPPYKLFGEVETSAVHCYDRRSKRPMILRLFPDVLDIIRTCKRSDICLSICSKSPVPSAGRGILGALGVWDHFWNPQIYARSKKVHMGKLVSSSSKISYENILFFDDCPVNIRECSVIGVTSYHVDPRQGLTWISLRDGLLLHRRQRRAQPSIRNYFLSSETKTKKKRSVEYTSDSVSEIKEVKSSRIV